MEQELITQIAEATARGVAMGMKANGLSYGAKAPATTAAATGWMHGVGGLFGVPGLHGDIISARITPRGIASMLAVKPDQYTHPEFGYITGVTEAGAEPATECATCPSGTTQSCIQSACFGFVCRETRTLTPNRAIERINRGEIDLTLVNDILGLTFTDPFLAVRNYDRRTVLQIATVWGMMEVGMMLQAQLVPMIWQGNPANNVGTGYAEFNGLDILVNVNKIDYHTGNRCQALDSDVKQFGYQNITVQNAAATGYRIVEMLNALEAYVYHNAERMGLLPATWALVLRPEAWYELTEIWPVAYYTTRNIAMLAGNTNFLDSSRVSDLRDQMRSGMFIYLNGRRHMVITDDGIAEETSADNAAVPAGSFASDFFFIPLKFMGNRDATYLQHKDYRATSPELTAARLEDEIWTDAGRFLWTTERIKWCYTLSAKVEPRVVLLTPQIAGRVNNVVYTPEQHLRSPFQDDYYFRKGGVDSRAYPYGQVYTDNARGGVTPTRGTCQD